MLHRSENFKADPITVEKILANDKMTGHTKTKPTAILGDKFVSGVRYKDIEKNEEITIPATGVFVEIGMLPNTEYLKDIVELDEYKRIKIDPWTQQTNTKGIWAAGDCTTVKYHQNNISAGDAVKALEDIYINLKAK